MMFKGKTTTELYEQCLKTGFCKDHLRDLEITDLESYEVQRKAFLFLRLQIFGPIVLRKSFSTEKMKTLFSVSNYFCERNDPDCGTDFKQTVLVLDAIVVFTLCHFCKVCCVGALFRPNQKDFSFTSKEDSILKILLKKKLEESDIRYLVPLLNENFQGNDENFYKLCYVATLLLVRNFSLSQNLKAVIAQQDKEFNSVPEESKLWYDIGSEAYKKGQSAEAVNAYTSGLKYSPFSVPLLINRAEVFVSVGKYEEAALDCYEVLMIDPKCITAFTKFAVSLYHLDHFTDCVKVVTYTIEKCGNNPENAILLNLRDDALTKINEQKSSCNKSAAEADTCQVKVAEEKKDIPELIEASDSETETLDVPELMEASDDSSSESDSSDSPPPIVKNCTTANQVVNSWPRSSEVEVQISLEEKEAGQKPKKTDSNNIVEVPKSSEDEKTHETKELDTNNENAADDKFFHLRFALKDVLKMAAKTLLDGCGLLALPYYREALETIKASPKIYNKEEWEIVCIKYALGIAYFKAGGCEDLQKAISTFKGIAEDHYSVTFPAAYYGIALAYHKLNRFKEALHYLQIIEDILQKGIQMKVYYWPETFTIIEETKCENLKTLVAQLLSECENPPPPDATCRFQECSLQPAIYYTDPDFKGFFAIQCSDQCSLQFHPHCWRILKTMKHFTDKEFLDQSCITPDCEGVIIKTESFDKEGNLGKVFVSVDNKKLTKKKTKLERKLEVKEEKRRKRKDSCSRNDVTTETTSETTNEIQPEAEPDNNKRDYKTEAKERVEGPVGPQIPVNAELFTVLKKEKIVNENTNKTPSKVKEKENKKSKHTYSIDEFLERTDICSSSSSEYQQRLNVLRQSNQSAVDGHWINYNTVQAAAPKFETPRLTNSFAEAEPVSYGIDDFPLVSPPNASAATNDINVHGAVENTCHPFNPPILVSPQFSEECAKKNIYCYLKNILGRCGPLREDDPILVAELQTFPGEANAMIADCGGLGKFLQKSVDFAFVGETYVCLVDQLTLAYKKINSPHVQLSSPGFSNSVNSIDSIASFNLYALQYSLNPDAKEYSPPAEFVGRNSPQLVSAISKLRQPLTVDEVPTNGSSDNSVSSIVDEGITGNNLISPITTTNCLNGNVSCSVLKQMELANKCTEAVQAYFSTDADDYRSYIDGRLQPYTIVKMGKKSNRCIQTETTEVEKVSVGTSKTDEELERLKEVVSHLTEENVYMKEQTELLGEQCSSAMDNVTKCQRKSSVELTHLKKELEDANRALEEQMKDFKSRESKLEKEIKHLTESFKKSKEDQSTQKTEIDNLLVTNESLKSSLAQMEERVKLLRNEKNIIKTTLELQLEKLKADITILELAKVKALKRAETAELELLHVKKTEYLKRIDNKTAEAVQRVNELQDGMSIANLNPVFIKNFGTLLVQIQNYIAKLGGIRINFSILIDEQITAVKNGTPLQELKVLEMNELDEIPSWTTQMPTQNGAPNAQLSSWMTQVQMMNSVMNSAPANAYRQHPITSVPPPSFPTMPPMRQMARFHSSSNLGAIPKTNGNQTFQNAPTIQNSNPLKSLPPGLQDPLQLLSSKKPSDVPQPPMARAQSPAVVAQPPMAMMHPSAAVAQPPTAMKHPSAAVAQPPTAMKQPSAAVAQPPTAMKQPSAAVAQPPTAMKQPSAAVAQPPTAMKQPSAAVAQPPTAMKQPSAVVTQPQSVTLPSQEAKTPKVKTPKAKLTASNSTLENCGTLTSSRSSLMSNSSIDVKNACDSRRDSLELDYNLKRSMSPKTATFSESSAASSKSTPKNSYEKLIQRLRIKYPDYTQAQLAAIVRDFRSQKSSLSGLSFNMIIDQLVAIIEEKKQRESKVSEPITITKSRMIQSKTLMNKKFALADSTTKDNGQNSNPKKCPWSINDETTSKQWKGKGFEEGCTICFEEMTPQTAYKVDCGHVFHLTCIKEWLNKKSDCPICRVHLLLPEDYPAL